MMSLQRKPAKTSRIALFLDAYIKKRRIDNLAADERKELTTLTQSKEELVRQIVMEKAINNSNVLSYACTKYDAQSNLDQYQQLENFILNQHKNEISSTNIINIKQENGDSIDVKPQQQASTQPLGLDKLYSTNSLFSNLLFPAFQHTFIDFLINGYKVDALEFLKQKEPLFNDEKNYKYLRDITGTAKKTLDEDERPLKINTKDLNQYIYDMKTKKYKVSLPEDQFTSLMAFLKSQDSMFLVQIINRHMDLVVTTDEDETGSGPYDLNNGASMEVGGDEKNGSKDVKHDDSDRRIKKETNPKESLGGNNEEIEKRLGELYAQDSTSLPLFLKLSFCNINKGLTQVKITDDGDKVVAAYEDSTINLWCGLQSQVDTEAHRPVSLKGHSRVVYDAEFMGSNSEHFISSSGDQTVRLWRVDKEDSIVAYRGHTAEVVSVAVSPIGGQFSSASCDNTSKLWCCDRVYPLRSFIGHTKAVNRVTFHQNGCYLASSSNDGVVRMWDVNAVGRCVRLMTCQPCVPLISLVFSPDGKSLAAGAIDGSVKVWDIGSGSLIKSFSHQSAAQNSSNPSTHYENQQKLPFFCPVYSVTFNPQSCHLFSGGGDGKVHVWDMNDNSTSQKKNNRCQSPSQASLDAAGIVVNLKYSSTNILYVLTKPSY